MAAAQAGAGTAAPSPGCRRRGPGLLTPALGEQVRRPVRRFPPAAGAAPLCSPLPALRTTCHGRARLGGSGSERAERTTRCVSAYVCVCVCNVCVQGGA